MDQPAAPDVAPRARPTRCCSSSRSACASRGWRAATCAGWRAACSVAAAGPRAVDGLHVLSPLVIPLHGRRAPADLNARLLRAQVGRAARSLGLRAPDPVELRAAGRLARRHARAVRGRLPLRRRHRRPEGRGGGGLPRRRGALRGARRPRARLGAGARRAHAHAQPARALRAQRGRHRPLRHARSRTVRPIRRWPRCRARGSSSPAPWSRRSSTSTCSAGLRGRGRTGRSRWSARSAPGDPRTDISALRARCRTCTCSARGPTRRCPRCCAAPTSALVPYAINDADALGLPDEGLRVPRRRAAGRHHPRSPPSTPTRA